MENRSYFSIYKLDTEFIWKKLMGKQGEIVDFDGLCNWVLDNILERNDAIAEGVIERWDNSGEYGMVYQTKNKPNWLSTLKNSIEQKNNQNKYINTTNKEYYNNIINTKHSFLLIIREGEDVYATTGGHAYSLIKPFIIRGFGLSMISKLFDPTDSVIQELTENNMVGSRHTSSVVNRTFTTFTSEKDYAVIMKKINAKATYQLCEKLELLDQDETPSSYKKYNIISTDALTIKKALSLQECKQLLRKISEIHKEQAKFALNYFLSLTQTGLSKATVQESLYTKMIDDTFDFQDILIVGEEYLKYISAYKWAIHYKDRIVEERTDTPFTFDDIFQIFVKDKQTPKKTVSGIKEFLTQWKVSSYDEDDKELMPPTALIDAIDFHFYDDFLVNNEYGKEKNINKTITLYLNAGDWYALDESYTTFIDQEFRKLTTEKSPTIKKLYENYDLNRIHNNEKEYNDSFNKEKHEQVILTDKILISNVEICDLIVFDGDKTYLICNKSEPSGVGSRDLLNQISTAATLIYNDERKLKEYYQKLVVKQKINGENMGETEFCNKLKKAYFISSYIKKDLLTESKLTYAKLLSVQTAKYLRECGLELFVFSPRRLNNGSSTAPSTDKKQIFEYAPELDDANIERF